MKTKLFSKLFNLLFIETTFNPQTFSTTSCTINKLLTFQRVLQKSMNILIELILHVLVFTHHFKTKINTVEFLVHNILAPPVIICCFVHLENLKK